MLELPVQNEIQIQAEIFQTCWNYLPETRWCLFHVPNEGNRSVQLNQQLKASGLIPGTPDLFLLFNRQVHIFEIKDLKNFCSPEQKLIHCAYSKQGHFVYLFRSAEPCINLIRCIIKQPQLVGNYSQFISPFAVPARWSELESEYFAMLAKRKRKK